MHNGMDYVQQNGKKSMSKYTLTYQLMQAFDQLTRSFGIKPLSSIIACVSSCDHPFAKHLDLFSKCVQHECMRYCNEVPLVHVESHIAEFWLIRIITRYEI